MVYLEINDKRYPAAFGMYAVKKLARRLKVKMLFDIGKVFQQVRMDQAEHFVYACIENGCVATGEEPPSIKEITDHLNLNLKALIECMQLLKPMLEDAESAYENHREQVMEEGEKN